MSQREKWQCTTCQAKGTAPPGATTANIRQHHQRHSPHCRATALTVDRPHTPYTRHKPTWLFFDWRTGEPQ